MEATGDSETRLVIQRLEATAAGLIRNSLAPSSQRSYTSAQTQYLKFCSLINQVPVPATEQLLVLFAAHVAQSCAHSTVRMYLAAVRHMHISKGHRDPLDNTLQLQLLLRGIKRIKPSLADSRLPITPLILQAILEVVTREPHSYTNVMMWAACCLGFFAFLRSGEFTVNGTYDKERHLGVEDVAVDSWQEPALLAITLRYSKTDQDRRGITLYIGRTQKRICPISALLAYLVLRRRISACGPLFVAENGSPLSRDKLVSWLKSTLAAAGIDASHFSGHSFRIGAASTAAAKGIEDSTIQALGRWQSDSFKRYIRLPRQELAAISQTLVS